MKSLIKVLDEGKLKIPQCQHSSESYHDCGKNKLKRAITIFSDAASAKNLLGGW